VCGEQQVIRLPSIGRAFLYHRFLVMHCPQFACGRLCVIDPYRAAYTSRGYACSDCTLCITAEALERKERGLLPMYLIHPDTGRLLREEKEPANKRKKTKLVKKVLDKCEICDKATRALDYQSIKGFWFHACKAHRFRAIEQQCNKIKLAKKPDPDCEKKGDCICRNHKSTCTGEWTRLAVLATIDYFEYTGSLGLANSVAREATALRKGKGKGRGKAAAAAAATTMTTASQRPSPNK
jgi:hypothetical protein